VKDVVRVDARSVLSLMTLGVRQGETISIEAGGDDAESAVEALAKFLSEYVEPEEE
jgi:phosphotransferase system HPr (HPr) family protein